MKIKQAQVKRIIKEELQRAWNPSQVLEGYTVPEFETYTDMEMFLDELEPQEEVDQAVIDPESNEEMIPAGESMEMQDWYEDSQWFVEPEEEPKDPYDLDDDWEEQDRLEREEEERLEREEEEAEEKYEALKEKIMNDAEDGGEDWAMDTMHDAYNNPKMWQDGSSYQQWDSPGDYVLQYGQDASADIASGYTEWADSNEVMDLYSSLPDENRDSYSFGYGNSRPSKQIFKDIVADAVYTGIGRGVSKYIEKYGEWISKEDPAQTTIAASYKRVQKIIKEEIFRSLREVYGNPIGSGDPSQEIFDWAEEGNRVTIAGKNVWAGLGNRSGLHSYADELTREKWAKSGDRFMKKIGKLPAGTEVELKRYQSTNRDRGNWVTAGTVTTIGSVQGSTAGGEVPSPKRMRGIIQDLSMAYDRDIRSNEITVSLYQGSDAPFHGKNWEVTIRKSRMLFKDQQSDEYAEWDGHGWELYTLY